MQPILVELLGHFANESEAIAQAGELIFADQCFEQPGGNPQVFGVVG